MRTFTAGQKTANLAPLRASAILLQTHHVEKLIEQLGGLLSVALYIEQKRGITKGLQSRMVLIYPHFLNSYAPDRVPTGR